MAWWGRVIAGTLGFIGGGPIGGVLGYVIGNMFDKRQAALNSEFATGWSSQERIQTAFFATTFSVLGYIAKVDGYVSPKEIQFAEHVMINMSLNADQREVAIELFNAGKEPDFQLEDILRQFSQECGRRKNLKRMFLEIQITGAMADGQLDSMERQALRHISSLIGISIAELEQMINAAESGSRTARRPDTPALADDYKMLGLSEGADDAEIKRAYRRKMSQLHPDKLVSKGLPDEMIEMATEKTKQIRAAYDRIRDYRKQQSTVH